MEEIKILEKCKMLDFKGSWERDVPISEMQQLKCQVRINLGLTNAGTVGYLKNRMSHQDQQDIQGTKHKETLNVFPLPPLPLYPLL